MTDCVISLQRSKIIEFYQRCGGGQVWLAFTVEKTNCCNAVASLSE